MLPARLLIGLCTLLLGRRLFWLFVAAVGFALGMEVGARLFAGSPPLIVLTVAVIAGAAGAVLARAAQELMVGVVGFVAGSYLGTLLLVTAMPYPGRYVWFAVFGGGLVGAFLLLALFGWALIVLSSLVGSGIILQGLDVPGSPLLYVALTSIGIIVQASAARRWPPRPRR